MISIHCFALKIGDKVYCNKLIMGTCEKYCHLENLDNAMGWSQAIISGLVLCFGSTHHVFMSMCSHKYPMFHWCWQEDCKAESAGSRLSIGKKSWNQQTWERLGQMSLWLNRMEFFWEIQHGMKLWRGSILYLWAELPVSGHIDILWPRPWPKGSV